MRKLIVAGAVGALVLMGCDKDSSKADLDEPKVAGDYVAKDYEALSPDKVTVFLNVDDHPTIVRVCLDGLAWRTVSNKYAELNTPAVARVPEWDAVCAAAKASK